MSLPLPAGEGRGEGSFSGARHTGTDEVDGSASCGGVKVVTNRYTFVDYATQAYAALVAILILCFHNDTVPHWRWLLAAHLATLALVHGFIRWHARGQPGMVLDFLRHFYPVLLYTWFFCETGWLNRMFFRDYLDPMVIRWDQALFGFQPSVWFMQKLPCLAVSEVLYAAYFSYYVMIVGVGVTLFLRNRQQFFHYVSVVSFVFYVCYLLYLFLPVIGPPVFFREIPGYTLPAGLQQLAPIHSYPPAVVRGPFYRLSGGSTASSKPPARRFPAAMWPWPSVRSASPFFTCAASAISTWPSWFSSASPPSIAATIMPWTSSPAWPPPPSSSP